MQAFLKQAWQRRLTALSLGSLLTASPLLAQGTVPLAAPAPPAKEAPRPVRDAVEQNREIRETNQDNREVVRDQNQLNREQNRDNRADAIDPTDRRDERQDRRQRIFSRIGAALNTATDGITISEVQPNTAFGSAGFRNNDVILRVGDRRFNDNPDFFNWLTTVQPGQKLGITVQRDGREETINWTPSEQWSREFNADYQADVSENQATLGITLDAHHPQAAVVAEVSPGSLADRAGIRPRDKIDSLNGEKIRNAQDFGMLVSKLGGQAQIDLGFTRVVNLTSVAKPVTTITIPLPDRGNPAGTLPMPVTPRPRANPATTPPNTR